MADGWERRWSGGILLSLKEEFVTNDESVGDKLLISLSFVGVWGNKCSTKNAEEDGEITGEFFIFSFFNAFVGPIVDFKISEFVGFKGEFWSKLMEEVFSGNCNVGVVGVNPLK